MLNPALFVSGDVIARKVKLPDGNEADLYFRELPSIDFRVFHEQQKNASEEVRAKAMFTLIVKSLCNEDGTPALKIDQAMRLRSDVANSIAGIVLEINGMEAPPKTSAPEDETGSGTS